MIAIIIGIDHGYYAIKTRQVSFPSGIIRYDYEPYTMQNVLQYQGKPEKCIDNYVCKGRYPVQGSESAGEKSK